MKYDEKELAEKKAKLQEAQEAVESAEQELKAIFEEGVNELISQGKYSEAKEYLRPMPSCGEKVLFFRQIILLEKGL